MRLAHWLSDGTGAFQAPLTPTILALHDTRQRQGRLRPRLSCIHLHRMPMPRTTISYGEGWKQWSNVTCRKAKKKT